MATVTETTTVAALLTELAVQNIGAMVVIGADGLAALSVRPGIDVRARCGRAAARRGPDLLRRPVAEIMSPVLVSCGLADPVDDLAALMTNNRVRRSQCSTAAGWRASSASATS